MMPGLRDWRFRIAVALGVGLWFGLVYFGAYAVTVGKVDLPKLQTAWDRAMPFWPGMAVAYLSVTPFLCLPLLLLPDRREVGILARTLALQIALAGMIYLLFPVATTPHPAQAVPVALHVAEWVNLDFNSFPSLHVALTATVAGALWHHPWGRAIALWAGLIIVSTLLTWQHVLADVAGGLALAAFSLAMIAPMVRRSLPPDAG